jgi:hypothetical protein
MLNRAKVKSFGVYRCDCSIVHDLVPMISDQYLDCWCPHPVFRDCVETSLPRSFRQTTISKVCLLLENGEIQCVEARDRPIIRLALPNPATPAPPFQVRRRSLGATLRSGNQPPNTILTTTTSNRYTDPIRSLNPYRNRNHDARSTNHQHCYAAYLRMIQCTTRPPWTGS